MFTLGKAAMTELNFRLSEIAKERSNSLLSKVSGVPVEAIERLQTPMQQEEITEEVLQQLDALSKSLDICEFELLPNEESKDAFAARSIEVLRQRKAVIDPEVLATLRDLRSGHSTQRSLCEALGICKDKDE